MEPRAMRKLHQQLGGLRLRTAGLRQTAPKEAK
jgi:hypothetical protein